MNKYDVNNFTWGYELELGDVDRRLTIPEKMGSWEYAETDIVNIHGGLFGKACDPLGKSPIMGGEINLKPRKTTEEATQLVIDMIEFFRKAGNKPSASCVNHGHLHVHVPNLKNDIDSLKKLTKYILENQRDAIRILYQYSEYEQMKFTSTARTYLKWDGGREMPSWMGENIINNAKDFKDFIRIQCCGKDSISMGRPFRYAINTYCMKHTNTIEFRLFRATLNPKEIHGQFEIVKEFMNAALNTSEPFLDIIARRPELEFPKFTYNHDHYVGWENSKWDKSRGKKERKYYEID